MWGTARALVRLSWRGGAGFVGLGGTPWARCFAYEDTLAFRLHGPKPKAIVIHPVLSTLGKTKPWPQLVLDAEEGLGLARANRWDLLPGPNNNGEPIGGWDEEALAAAEEREEQRRLASPAAIIPEGWHLDRGEEESDDEFDVHEEAWRSDNIRRQWAETCVVKVRHIDSNTYFGKGKTQELALYVAHNPCDFVFVNTTLTPAQSSNLETIFNNSVLAADAKQRREEDRVVFGKYIPSVEVYDRTRLVMEIFAMRARTSTAKLQVNMARLAYMKARMTLLSRAKIRDIIHLLHENFGPFKEVLKRDTGVEVQYHYEVEPFETERKLLRWNEARYKSQLEKEQRAKKVQRDNRGSIPTIGIVGYTNVGKTSLMNALTGSKLKERDLLFQTLDTTFRRLRLPSGGHAIVADSIGFIQHLPHNLFAAFKGTIEELVHCDVLLHVRDISHPQRKMQKDLVLQTLRDAGVPEAKLESSVIEVWNKIDLLPAMDYVPPEAVPVCARDGTGVQDLLQVLDVVISAQVGQRRVMAFPEASLPRALDFLRRHNAAGAVETLAVADAGAEETDGAKSPDSGQAILTIEAVLPVPTWQRWQVEVGAGTPIYEGELLGRTRSTRRLSAPMPAAATATLPGPGPKPALPGHQL